MLRLLLCVALICSARSEGTAHLLVSKIITNEFAVENRDLTVQYTLINVGTGTAQNVQLMDESFLTHEFELIHGLLTTSWDRIPNKANVSNTVILRPFTAGVYNISWARVTYTSGEDGKTEVGYSSAPGFFKILPYPEFARTHSSHITEWIAFFLMSTPTVLLPFLLWYSSHSKYEKIKNKRA